MRIGGAQAIAAMAFGTESVPKVDVISGPGNIYVTLAKQAVYGQVGIDSLAGPSEVLVIADQSAQPEQVAADLLAQAEHDPLASSVLITTSHQLEQAWKALPENLRDALELAHRRISEFHQRQRPEDIRMEGAHGEQLGRRWRPVQRAGLYVPGGRAAYPSTVLMNAVPARVAGVEQVVICSPAGSNGQVNPVVLAAAHLAGVHTVMRIGGAQAIAAMAFGTESVPKVLSLIHISEPTRPY